MSTTINGFKRCEADRTDKRPTRGNDSAEHRHKVEEKCVSGAQFGDHKHFCFRKLLLILYAVLYFIYAYA